MSGGGVTYYLNRRVRNRMRMIIIDPRYTDTGAGREDEWIPFAREQMPHWLTVCVCHDHRKHGGSAILDKYCVGYDEKTLPASAPRKMVIIKPIFWAKGLTA